MRGTRVISTLALLLLVCGCRIEPPLHLRQAVEVNVRLTTSVKAEFLWQTDWDSRWQFDWDEDTWGPLGYQMPKSYRMHIYTQGPDHQPVSHRSYAFMGTSGEVSVFLGVHNLLFHNNDSEVLLFRSEDDLSDIYGYTRIVSSGLKATTPVKSLAQKQAATKAGVDEDMPEEAVAFEPDDLFALYKPDFELTDDLSQYEYVDGTYIIRINGDLVPESFIYLIQVRLQNNFGRVVGAVGGAALTGVAQEVNLVTSERGSDAVTIPTDVRINRDKDPDLLGIRVHSFGIPGCNPYDEVSVAAAPEGKHFLVLSVTYFDYTYKNIRVDITDAFRALPTGGVINLELDVNDFPPESGDGSVTGGGGFKPLMDDWKEERGGFDIVS